MVRRLPPDFFSGVLSGWLMVLMTNLPQQKFQLTPLLISLPSTIPHTTTPIRKQTKFDCSVGSNLLDWHLSFLLFSLPCLSSPLCRPTQHADGPPHWSNIVPLMIMMITSSIVQCNMNRRNGSSVVALHICLRACSATA